LGPKDYGYKFIKKLFASKINQWLYARMHPNFGMWLALYFSQRSRVANGDTDEIYFGEDKERLIIHAKELLKQEHYDFFIFGHRHLPLDLEIAENSRYINLGDWVKSFSYVKFDGDTLSLKYFV